MGNYQGNLGDFYTFGACLGAWVCRVVWDKSTACLKRGPKYLLFYQQYHIGMSFNKCLQILPDWECNYTAIIWVVEEPTTAWRLKEWIMCCRMFVQYLELLLATFIYFSYLYHILFYFILMLVKLIWKLYIFPLMTEFNIVIY